MTSIKAAGMKHTEVPGQDFRTAPYIYYAYSSLFIENNEQNNRAPLGLKCFVLVISLF